MSLLFAALESGNEKVALTFGTQCLAGDRLRDAVGGCLAEIREEGVKPGERVAVVAEPTIDAAIRMLAVVSGGYVLVPINPKSGPKERTHLLSDAQPKLVLEGAAPQGAALRGQPREVDDEPALILYTSGTTGQPKGAVISARNIAANLDGLADAWQWTENDTVLHALPLFHVHGLVLGLFGSIRVGGGLHWLGKFDPAELCRAMPKASMLFGVPTIYQRLLSFAQENSAAADALRSARLLISGSAGLPRSVHARFRELGLVVRERYGLTETLINCAQRADEEPAMGTVGRPVRGVELEVRDATGELCHVGELGEIYVRGGNVFSLYLGRPDATREVRDEAGWFRTGDMAMQDAQGNVQIVGRRATDLIKTGGYKVGAGEIESCLLDVPGVSEVAVIGVADDDLGQRIVAYVVGDAALQAQVLIDWVAAELSPHKRPRQVVFIDTLPRNAMGKVQKKRLPPA